MVSLIRTNWINVQEFVSQASVLAGLRMEEIKRNKRDLYAFGMSEYVYVSIRMYVRMRVSGEKEQAREIEGERKRERKKRGREQNHRKMDQLSRTRRNDVVR